ncbi:MAG TPA: hypothetical protein QGI22_01815 [Candidatus Woesearchaeota archaeon]|jgi:glutathione synthase/RimK-type ligase-like ATP-grasp enzyme|nr:hypothetical protein [Candidatus Woesearchaeota archaeon]HJN56678.1 hypothetical protein [Candidatus Woesearchaeota archaeon]|tara:strand:+ start:7765 stop:8814 length:1050 start_codon:yes stop_codon:yes gene_type:complete
MKTKTLLVLGDNKDFDTYKKIIRQKRFFNGSSIAVKSADYESVLAGRFPNISTATIIILPCFPFVYWDKHIEPKKYKGVYGNKSFYAKFNVFWKKTEKKINNFYKKKKLIFINELKNLALDRDKENVKMLVSKRGVSIPKRYNTRNLKSILKIIDDGKKLFVKVRYGSMGKGITYLEKKKWMTNFRFRKGKIQCRKSDYGWSFVNCTNNLKFLKNLLKQEIIIEEAIDSLIINKRKFDLRLYVYKNRILYAYGRTAPADSITTNISQGARGEKTSFVKKLPKKQLERAKKQAVLSIKALGLNFGGVDLMLCPDKKNVKFIEVNTFPGFPRVRRFNLSKYLINEIIMEFK